MEEWKRQLNRLGYKLCEQERIHRLAEEFLHDGTLMRFVPLLNFPDDKPSEFYSLDWEFGPPHNVVVENRAGIPIVAYYNGNKPTKGDVIGVRTHGYKKNDEGKTYGFGEVICTI